MVRCSFECVVIVLRSEEGAAVGGEGGGGGSGECWPCRRSQTSKEAMCKHLGGYWERGEIKIGKVGTY